MITNREIIRLHILDIIFKNQMEQRAGLKEESIYGAHLIDELISRFIIDGRQSIKVGANVVYPILQELSEGEDEERILESWWKGEATTKNRYKRYYKLTEKGCRKFEQMKLYYRQPIERNILLLQKTLDTIFSR